MILKFIGKDESMGLKHGKNYMVSIKSYGNLIWVEWQGEDKPCVCPYSSPQSFASNWERGNRE